MSGYTVLALETSGYSQHRDRVVEVGLVHVADDGLIREHWATLVDPGGDVGPTDVHGITAEDVQHAPRFAQIAPRLIHEWAGTTLVAHHTDFTLGFLTAELERAGFSLEDLPLEAVSTMHWAPEFLDHPGRRLADCCAAAGIILSSTHTAVGNALATAELLRYFLHASDNQPPWLDRLDATRSYPWPEPEAAETVRTAERHRPRRRRQGRWLDDLVGQLPQTAHHGTDSYLVLLEEAMLDHVLSTAEREELSAAAAQAGLDADAVNDLHRAYLQSLAATAAADGVVSPEERAVLQQVARSLDLPETDVQEALTSADRDFLGDYLATSTSQQDRGTAAQDREGGEQ